MADPCIAQSCKHQSTINIRIRHGYIDISILVFSFVGMSNLQDRRAAVMCHFPSHFLWPNRSVRFHETPLYLYNSNCSCGDIQTSLLTICPGFSTWKTLTNPDSGGAISPSFDQKSQWIIWVWSEIGSPKFGVVYHLSGQTQTSSGATIYQDLPTISR